MIPLDASVIILRVVLGLLAAYHLAMGWLAVLSPATAGRASAMLYRASVADAPELRYAVRMLGLYAVAIGSLLALATWSPSEYRAVIIVTAGLQLARAACRILLRRELAAGFDVPARRNYLSASLLVAEACVLAITVPLAASP
jgi:hypothetical protein